MCFVNIFIIELKSRELVLLRTWEAWLVNGLQVCESCKLVQDDVVLKNKT